jgi:hypothetical protein
LAACAPNRPSRWRTRRFLTGLSSDELQFIAGYLGTCILGSPADCRRAESDPAASRDQEHKLILLQEFLGRTGIAPTPPRRRVSLWN